MSARVPEEPSAPGKDYLSLQLKGSRGRMNLQGCSSKSSRSARFTLKVNLDIVYIDFVFTTLYAHT